jgi:hypothetical protein
MLFAKEKKSDRKRHRDTSDDEAISSAAQIETSFISVEVPPPKNGGNISLENPIRGSTYHHEFKKMQFYLSKISDGELSTLGIADAYDLHQVLSSAHSIACLENLPSSIIRTHGRNWTPSTLRRIVNEAPDSQDGNGITTLCSHFLIDMHEASSKEQIKKFVAILHDLVAWLYLNYDSSQNLDSDGEEYFSD